MRTFGIKKVWLLCRFSLPECRPRTPWAGQKGTRPGFQLGAGDGAHFRRAQRGRQRPHRPARDFRIPMLLAPAGWAGVQSFARRDSMAHHRAVSASRVTPAWEVMAAASGIGVVAPAMAAMIAATPERIAKHEHRSTRRDGFGNRGAGNQNFEHRPGTVL